MKNAAIKLLIAIIMLFPFFSYSQLVITPGGVPAQLVQNILVGSGVTVTNVTFTGSTAGIGSFNTGAMPTNLGFSSGIILASGNVSNAVGPNSSGSTTTGFSLPGDALLNSILPPGQTTYDATILEFDFVPISDTIEFDYVFGSEEYPEWLNSFNDVFGFFISGGYNPVTWTPFVNQNIALVPGTSIPVSIDNINNGPNNFGPCVNCAYYIHNVGGASVEYDGMTTVLTAKVAVIPCISYHLKIAIADVNDGAYDSGVFLKANSFISNNVQLSTSTAQPGIDSIAIEGCNDAIITFKLAQPTIAAKDIYYSISGSAVNGVDYTSIPFFVTVPAGMDSVNLVISPIIDSIAEPLEKVRIIANTSFCTTDTVWIPIKDYTPLDPVTSNDTIICATSATLVTYDTNGLGPYSYIWSTNDTTGSITVSPFTSTLYTVEITDVCNQSHTDSVMVTVSKPVIITVDDTICNGDIGTVTAAAVGATGFEWNTGDLTPVMNAAPITTTTYSVIVTDTLGCKDTADAIILVNALPVPVLTNDTTICAGDSIDIIAGGGVSYQWSTGASDSVITTSPPSGTLYSVTVTDINGCSENTSMWLDINPLPVPIISAPSDTLCRGATIILTVTGGDSYLWNTGAVTSSITVTPPISTDYSVVATNTLNGISCSASDDFNLGVKRCNRFYVPSAFSPNGDGINDDFGPEGVFKGLETFEVYIFDRYGKAVFFSDSPLNRWDGNSDGVPVGEGVYTYRMFIKEAYSDHYEMVGTVSLLR